MGLAAAEKSGDSRLRAHDARMADTLRNQGERDEARQLLDKCSSSPG